VREGVPEKGDLRHPTLGGTIFVGVFLGLAAAVLSMGRDWHLAVHPCGADLPSWWQSHRGANHQAP
jgi:hypothetical protein